jgi:uncharacterized protein YjlB
MIATAIYDHILTGDEIFPNNARLPLLIYKKVFKDENAEKPEEYEKLFGVNGWFNSWRNGIFDYHHYHSNTHEVLGIYGGFAKVQFGGSKGITMQVTTGDVVLIPAGVAHKCIGASDDFKCVGAYPDGKSYDINKGLKGERPGTDKNIENVPLPQADPIGEHGELFEYWS